MIENVKKDADQRMQKAVEAFRHELTKLRTGRAHPSLLDHVKVESYGSSMPLSQVASVVASDARMLTITPWDKNMVTPIEKAIMQADLGLNPSSSGQVIRVPLPPLTEERRRDLVKIVKAEAENARVSVRNVRRDANQHLKDALKAKSITEDDLHRTEEAVQKMTDKFVSELDKIAAAKEAELMEV